MRKNTKKAVCIFFAVLLLVCSFPISAFAVDPVSASVIANSFAQAITAYGASHGVSLTFDGITSGNTDQIGQSVHELWSRFRAGQQTADDYDTIAAAVFPGLYNKVVKAGGAAVVGMSIAQEYMSDIDGFWNWLLSGPAEMVKVDNAYQWNIDSQTGDVIAPVVNTINNSGFLETPVVSSSYATNAEESYKAGVTIGLGDNGSITYRVCSPTSQSDVYCFVYGSTGNYKVEFLGLSSSLAGSLALYNSSRKYYSGTLNQSLNVNDNGIYYRSINLTTFSESYVNVFSTDEDGRAYFRQFIANPDDFYATVKVQPYVGDAVAKPVPLPDVGDPDYGPVPWAGDLDIPWNDTLFGDGTGTLTDAQKGAITEELDGVIENDGTLVLEGDDAIDNPGTDTDDPPSSDPGDYGVVGLENIFPFCIPFDIYNFLNALAATPTAPHFTATLQLPAALGGAQTIDLDFDNPTFNQLAQLLRLLELLAFIVGLALLTRSMFIRG